MIQLAQLDADKLKRLQDFFQPVDPGGFPGRLSPLLIDNLSTLAIGFVRYIMLEFGIYVFMLAVLISGAFYIFSFGQEEAVGRAKKSILYSFLGFTTFVGANAGLNFYLKHLGKLADVSQLSLGRITGQIFNTMLLTAGVGFFVVFAYSGLRYFFTGGNEEAATNARRGMIYAFIGLIVLTTAYATSSFIIRRILSLGS